MVQAWRWIPKQAVKAQQDMFFVFQMGWSMVPSGNGTQLVNELIFPKIVWFSKFSTTQSCQNVSSIGALFLRHGRVVMATGRPDAKVLAAHLAPKGVEATCLGLHAGTFNMANILS